MGPLLVVFGQPGLGNLAYLLDRFEHVGIENLISVGLVEAFDEGILVRLPRLDERMNRTSMPRDSHHSVKATEVSSGPLSRRNA